MKSFLDVTRKLYIRRNSNQVDPIQMFYVLRNLVKFTGKHLCQSLQFFNSPETLFRKTLAHVFSCECCEISKNTFFHRTPLVAASVYWNRMHSYWLFASLKWLSIYSTFLWLMIVKFYRHYLIYKYNFACSLFLTTRKSTNDRKIIEF